MNEKMTDDQAIEWYTRHQDMIAAEAHQNIGLAVSVYGAGCMYRRGLFNSERLLADCVRRYLRHEGES